MKRSLDWYSEYYSIIKTLENGKRLSWDEYFLLFAKIAAERSTCDRLKAGAAFVRDRRILATGYNGSIPGEPHCDDIGHLIVEGHCTRTIHAEENAIIQCAKFGISLVDATAYITYSPCWNCFKRMVASGITKIVFNRLYTNDSRIDEVVSRQNIEYINMHPELPPHRSSDSISTEKK